MIVTRTNSIKVQGALWGMQAEGVSGVGEYD